MRNDGGLDLGGGNGNGEKQTVPDIFRGRNDKSFSWIGSGGQKGKREMKNDLSLLGLIYWVGSTVIF